MERVQGQGEGWPEERVTEFLDEISSAGDDYRRLVERLPAIVYSCELGETGRWRYVSPQVEEILGYSPEEWMADPGLWARAASPRRPRARARAGDAQGGRRAAARRRSTTG